MFLVHYSRQLLRVAFVFVTFLCSAQAFAQIELSFHSVNGSVLWGERWPHAFINMKGNLERDGQEVVENYGFTAIKASPAMLVGPVDHDVHIEEAEFIARTNLHFTLVIGDEEYDQIIAEMKKWRDAPGKYYNLNKRNCIHFTGAIAEIVGLKVEYPKKLRRKPKRWLNHITMLNPQLGAKKVR